MNATLIRNVPWNRIEASLKRICRRQPGLKPYAPAAMAALKGLVDHIGPQSISRRALRNIGLSLMTRKGVGPIHILSPLCLWIPAGAVKTASASALAQKHAAFLDSLGEKLPPWRLTFLFPPPEREDAEAEAYIKETCDLTRLHFADRPEIEVMLMSEYAPGMIIMEEKVIEEICASITLKHAVGATLNQRSKYYQEIGIPIELWPRRTRRTMAQYIILGRLAAFEGALLCNHTSANIRSAQYGGGGVLHNPVGFRG